MKEHIILSVALAFLAMDACESCEPEESLEKLQCEANRASDIDALNEQRDDFVDAIESDSQLTEEEKDEAIEAAVAGYNASLDRINNRDCL